MNYNDYQLIMEPAFSKAKDRYKVSGRYNLIMKIDKTVNNLLNNTSTTDMHPHPIQGSRNGDWECHVERNILLRYKFDHKSKTLALRDLGSHDKALRNSYNPDDNIEGLKYLI